MKDRQGQDVVKKTPPARPPPPPRSARAGPPLPKSLPPKRGTQDDVGLSEAGASNEASTSGESGETQHDEEVSIKTAESDGMAEGQDIAQQPSAEQKADSLKQLTEVTCSDDEVADALSDFSGLSDLSDAEEA